MNKQIKTWIPIILIGMFFLGLIFGRPYLLKFISQQQQRLLSQNKINFVENRIRKLYNYAENGESYSYTFLEFGSTACSACKQMEQVMKSIKIMYSNKVRVVFVSTIDKSSKDLMSYYGVVAIPFQVLLDKNGKEIYRHSGYISEKELEKYFK